jgi:hypothetical protein
MRMRRVMSSVTCLAVTNFSTLSNKWQDFREKKMLDAKCVLVFPAT